MGRTRGASVAGNAGFAHGADAARGTDATSFTCELFEDVTDAPLLLGGGGASPVSETALPALATLAQMAEEMGPERWRAVSDVAQVVANFLRCHPRVEALCYPGLKSDALFEEAARTLVGGFGPRVAFCVDGMWHEVACLPCDARAACLELERVLG